MFEGRSHISRRAGAADFRQDARPIHCGRKQGRAADAAANSSIALWYVSQARTGRRMHRPEPYGRAARRSANSTMMKCRDRGSQMVLPQERIP